MLLEDYESRNMRLQEVMVLIEELVKQIPMAEKLLEIKGVGIKTVSGFLAEVGDIRLASTVRKNCRSLQDWHWLRTVPESTRERQQ